MWGSASWYEFYVKYSAEIRRQFHITEPRFIGAQAHQLQALGESYGFELLWAGTQNYIIYCKQNNIIPSKSGMLKSAEHYCKKTQLKQAEKQIKAERAAEKKAIIGETTPVENTPMTDVDRFILKHCGQLYNLPPDKELIANDLRDSYEKKSNFQAYKFVKQAREGLIKAGLMTDAPPHYKVKWRERLMDEDKFEPYDIGETF